jgi:hypothetical protein
VQTAHTLEDCRRLLIQCVAERRVAAFVHANSYNISDNMDFVRAFTRPVIFTLSLDFIFVLFIPVFSNYLFLQLLLDSHNPGEPSYTLTHAQGPEIRSPFSRLSRLKVLGEGKNSVAKIFV